MEERPNNSKRLSAIAREFNIGVNTLIMELQKSKWYNSWHETWTLNSKITEEQYNWLKEQFELEIRLKTKADTLKRLRNNITDGSDSQVPEPVIDSLTQRSTSNKLKTKKKHKGRKNRRNCFSSRSKKGPTQTSSSVYAILTPMGNKR